MGVLNVIFYLLAIGIAVFIHEMGHYLVARKFGVIAEEFAIGFGTKLFSFDKGGTIFSLRLIPMGGFCKFPNEDKESLTMFPGLAHWKKLLILVSGVVMNLIAVVVLLFGLLWAGTGNMSFGDRFETAATGSVELTGELIGGVLNPTNWTDSGEEVTEEAVVTEEVVEKKTLADIGKEFIVQILSINLILFLFNILPIPVLDGGRIVMVGIEWIRGKPANEKFATIYYAVGAVIVLVIVIGSWFL